MEHAMTPATFLLRTDANPMIGVGHAMRLLALSQELIARGCRVFCAGDIEISWVNQAYKQIGIDILSAPTTPEQLCELAGSTNAKVVIFDGYEIPTEYGTALRERGISVMAMVDDVFGASQNADLYVDQNPGTTPRTHDASQQALAGAQYTMFRDDILNLRSDARTLPDGPAQTVFAVFGGTDPMGAAQVVIPLLLATQAPLKIQVISTSVKASDFSPGPQQSIEAIPPTPAWLELAQTCDLVITASGSSVWELLCLGRPIGVVCVADNQRPGYDLVVRDGLAAPIGELSALRQDDIARKAAITELHATLNDGELRRTRAIRGQQLLDGAGRKRVADALLTLTNR